MKAIETRYKGYRFRSRLEARWAVFFDALGLRWEYEKEGYDLGKAGWYLPDFWLPERDWWVEIKPGPLSREEWLKIEALCQQCQKTVLLIQGEPYEKMYRIQKFIPCGSDPDDEPEVLEDNIFVQCLRCSFIGVESRVCHYPDEPEYQPVPPYGMQYGICHNEGSGNAISDSLLAAYEAARSARFEHGETP